MLKSWLILSLAIWLTAQFIPGFSIKGLWGAVKVAALFGILNFLIGWFIYVTLGIVSLGLGFLFAFVTRTIVNAILLKITDALSDSLEINGFIPAILGALGISFIATVAELMTRHHGQMGWIWT
jgi:putative membrane protein